METRFELLANARAEPDDADENDVSDLRLPPPPNFARTNRILHGVAATFALAVFVQAQVELAGVNRGWELYQHYSDRSNNAASMAVKMNAAWTDWRMALVTVPTALHHLFMATRSTSWWVAFSKGRYSWYRWAEYSITNTAMTTRLAVVSGMCDGASLVMIAGLGVLVIVLGGLHERLASAKAPRPLIGSVFAMGSAAFLIQWIGIAMAFVTGVRSSDEGPPDWVYAVFAGLPVLDSAFPVVAWVAARARPPAYTRIDVAYTVLSLVVKQFFLQMLLYGSRSFDDDNGGN